MKAPTKEQVAALRVDYNLTQVKAASFVHVFRETWARWESGEREMHPAFYELARLKAQRLRRNRNRDRRKK